MDEAGARLETEIADLCREHGARLLGPNSLGLINTHHKMNAAFASHMPKVGGISVLSQSGALCSAILDWAASRKVGIATLLSMGNKADLCETDFLAAFRNDEKTKVVAGYLESINSGDEFIRVAESVAAVKPVVILKGGTTAAGSKAASSHTGALAGADIAYEAAFKRAGIIRADTFESLFDFATAFAMQPLPEGNRVAIITNAGGPGTMAADAVERAGMRMASIDPAIAEGLRAKLPAAARVGNPIDLLEDASPARYALAIEAIEADPWRGRLDSHPHAAGRDPGRPRPRGPSPRAAKGEAGVRRVHGRRGHLSRPPGTGAREPAQLPIAGARGGRPQGDAGIRGLAAPSRSESSPASRSTGAG